MSTNEKGPVASAAGPDPYPVVASEWVRDYDEAHSLSQERINDLLAAIDNGGSGFVQRWMCGMTPPDDEPVAYDGFGAPLYAHQIPPEGQE